MAVRPWRDVERTAEDYKKFFTSFGSFAELFGEELTLKHLMEIPFNELVSVEHFQGPNKWAGEYGEYIGTEMWTFEEWKGEWRRDVRAMGYTFLMPSKYQGLKHEKIIRPILNELFPWLEEFELNIYRIESTDHAEIYVKLEASVFGRCSLYVPIKALVERDVDAIKKRNIDYFNWYYGRRAQEDERFATYADTVLNDPVTLRFFDCLKHR